MICTVPIHEFNPCHEPGGQPVGGQFCSTKGTATAASPDGRTQAPILQGVDSARNAEALIAKAQAFRDSVGAPARPEEIALTEAALRALPLIHGTSIEGAVGAITEGLKSNVDMADRRKALEDDVTDLKESIVQAMGGTPTDRLRFPQLLDSGRDAYELQHSFDLDRDTAGKVAVLLEDLDDLQTVIAGTTHPADTKLGLDQFVFMTHGAKHQDYGRVGVVISNSAVEWATPDDIVKVASGSVDSSTFGTQSYDPEGVKTYQQTIVEGDDYYKAAAATTGTVTALLHRSRGQMWEVKARSVSKDLVRGFVVHDLDLAERLADRLAAKGITGKVLYIDEMRGQNIRRHYMQLKYMQRTGSWNEDLAKQWNDRDGGGAIYVL